MSERVEKVWGWEELIVNTAQYCGKLLHLKKGFQSSLHYHDLKHETFYVLSGAVELQVGEIVWRLIAGGAVSIFPKDLHRFTGITDAVIIEFSTHHDDADVVRLASSRAVPGTVNV